MSRRGMGELEAAVMESLWSSDDGLTPREVHDRVADDLGYTTVMTVVTRLWEKGLLAREPEGRSFRYRPTSTAAEHHGERMQAALAKAADRPAVLASFVSQLDDDDRTLLLDLLDDEA
ncbi:MAG: BlaI/MecI/CopY family transcriptional regulator [Acidimicrobiales bacterium]